MFPEFLSSGSCTPHWQCNAHVDYILGKQTGKLDKFGPRDRMGQICHIMNIIMTVNELQSWGSIGARKPGACATAVFLPTIAGPTPEVSNHFLIRPELATCSRCKISFRVIVGVHEMLQYATWMLRSDDATHICGTCSATCILVAYLVTALKPPIRIPPTCYCELPRLHKDPGRTYIDSHTNCSQYMKHLDMLCQNILCNSSIDHLHHKVRCLTNLTRNHQWHPANIKQNREVQQR